jgi:hypothetical protein
MRKGIRISGAALILGLGADLLLAQTSTPAGIQPAKQAFILPSLLDQAVSLSPPGLQPVLLQAIQPRWVSLNSSVATELSNLPNVSPASATRYTWDSTTGTLQASPQSLGPIFAERPETIGKNKFLFAVTNQSFSFDRLDKLDLRGFEVAYPLDIPLSSILPGAPPSVTFPGLIVADAYINVSINQTTAYFTYGLTHWLDATYAFTIVTSTTTVRGGAVLREQSSGQALVTLPTQSIQLSSTGPGDGIVRFKANLLSGPTHSKKGAAPVVPQSRKLKFALAVDLRLPTGDEFDYHGAGAFGVKPFLIASMTNQVISPHLNAGFQFNGSSYLASQYPTQKRRLPNQLFYTAGFDAALSPRLTASFDLLDQVIISGQRTLLRPFQSSDGTKYSQIYFDDITRQEFNASAGFKAKVVSSLVVTGNVMFRLNQAGLRTRISPLLGVSYLF